MSLIDGYTRIMGFSSSAWLHPFSSPAVVLATSSMMALVWAFQQHGWSYCIPCFAFVARKIAGLRMKHVTELLSRSTIYFRLCAVTHGRQLPESG
jgi:hypothetical protein